MTKNVSLYLSFLRFSAALLVFLSHVSGLVYPLGYIGDHSIQAVVGFFVLSGFVITWAALEKERGLRSYLVARSSRIYPVVFLGLLVTLAADRIGIAFAPLNYYGMPYFRVETLGSLFMDLTFLDQSWWHHTIFGSDEPYWSIGFEVPYYVIFGLLLYSKGTTRLILLPLYALVMGPIVLAYASLWALGSATYLLTKQFPARSSIGVSLGLLAVLAILYPIISHHFPDIHGIYDRHGSEMEKWIYFNIIGIFIAASIVAVNWLPKLAIPSAVSRSVEWLAGGSFTLYLMHQPIIVMLKSIFPVADPVSAFTVSAVGFGACYLLAELGERRKSKWRAICERIVEIYMVSMRDLRRRVWS